MPAPRILIVEDEPAIADLIARYLGQAGYGVAAAATSGEEALVQAARLLPDLALMDIALAGELDGVQTAELLRARFNIPVVFLTGLADDVTLQRSQSARAFGYVLKPFRQEDLKSSIELALGKHQVESQLRQVEQWFTAVIRSIGDGVITIDPQHAVTFLNPVAEALTGWTRADARGRPLEELFSIPPADGAALGQPSPAAVPQPTTLTARDGTQRPVEFTVAPIRDDAGAAIGSVLIVRDITEQKRAEAELNRSRDQLRSLAGHLQSVREEERTRISREIHDQLGQMLTGLRMDLAWLDRRVAALQDKPARAPLVQKLQSMSELLDQMVKTVRRISTDLRPEVLDDLGLAPALEWQAREWQSRTGVECRLTSELGKSAVPAELGTAFFRIFQEALTNVARHAQATRVTAELREEAGALRLEVRDNGRGIREEEARGSHSLGLVGMRERAALLGGELSVAGDPGHGTTVAVRIPLPPVQP